MARLKPQPVTFARGKGWQVAGKRYPSFEKASESFGDIKIRKNGFKTVKPSVVGKEFVYHKLGGFTGALEDLFLGRLSKHVRREEASYLRFLERRREKIAERKAQKRLTRFGFGVPVTKKYYTPYAFKSR